MQGRTFSHRLLLLIGSLGPLGHVPASGTVTVAVFGVPLFWFLSQRSIAVQIATVIGVALASVWLHHVGDRLLGEKDSRKLVWDEVVGYLVAVLVVPFTWHLAVVAFLVERVFDIAKVPPANLVERRLPGGWGVVGDDIVAGLYTRGILQLLITFTPKLVGL